MSDSPSSSLPISDGPGVPVFDCHVFLLHSDAGVSGRVGNLDGITADGPTERDVLMAIVKKFKKTVEGYVAVGEEIPFRKPSAEAAEGEVERWVPVHL